MRQPFDPGSRSEDATDPILTLALRNDAGKTGIENGSRPSALHDHQIASSHASSLTASQRRRAWIYLKSTLNVCLATAMRLMDPIIYCHRLSTLQDPCRCIALTVETRRHNRQLWSLRKNFLRPALQENRILYLRAVQTWVPGKCLL